MTTARRILLIMLGVCCVGLAGLGVFLPLLPTTPFLLLAAFAFANSSERLHQWLLDHHVFGSLIMNWRQHRAISQRAKVMSVLSMIAVLVISWLLDISAWIIVVQGLILACTATFVLSRPTPPRDD